MLELRKLVAKELRKLADKFDAGTTEASETQVMDIMSMLTHEVMSKEQACNYLNLSRSRFDDLVREKKIPKGRKRVGFKEKIWYRDELDECKRK
jgi:predicted DNA-binding transcriptional regulator AlpA